MIDKEAFSSRLKSFREAKGLKQQEMADRLKITRSAYAAYESGKNLPPAEVITQLNEVLGTTFEELIHGQPRPVSEPDVGYKTKYIEALEEVNRLQKQLLDQQAEELRKTQEQTEKLS